MNKIITTDYYGEWEEIKGFVGKKVMVEVHWPDGTKSLHEVQKHRGHGEAQVDMNNHPDHFPTQKLYIVELVHGVANHINLKGLKFCVVGEKK